MPAAAYVEPEWTPEERELQQEVLLIAEELAPILAAMA
jgi:hypothetical protein